jgi:pimeloyl-ACP methyl ester carboxylesterase
MVTLRTVEANGITQRFAEAGEGPLVVMLHGFPESWYSYRYQLKALAEAGYHAVAPDMRGYGGTDAPQDVRQYTYMYTAGDVVALATALGANRFVVVGHDWGSPAASSVGLFRPDLVRGVALLSVPYLPWGDTDVLTALTEALGPDNYQVFFQEPGAAEKVFEADVRKSVLAWLIGISGDAPEITRLDKVDADSVLPDFSARPLPMWLTEEDVAYYTSEFERTGFGGALKWYRTSKLNFELLAPWRRAPLLAPSLFVAGDRDPVVNWPGMRALIDNLKTLSMPNVTKCVLLEGAGHWIQQERPDQVNDLLLEFLAAVPD